MLLYHETTTLQYQGAQSLQVGHLTSTEEHLAATKAILVTILHKKQVLTKHLYVWLYQRMLELLAVVLQITTVIIWDWETPEKLFQVMAAERISKPWNVVGHLSTALS